MLDWNNLTPLTQFLLRDLHAAALLFVAVAYAMKLRQLFVLPRVRRALI